MSAAGDVLVSVQLAIAHLDGAARNVREGRRMRPDVLTRLLLARESVEIAIANAQKAEP